MKLNSHLNEGIYNQLVAQIDKIKRHNRQGSYKTRERYYEATKRFCKFLANQYRLQKFSNVKSKHLMAYAEYMKQKGCSAATIKTDLAAIRFYHDQSGSVNQLCANDKLMLEKRSYLNKDRAWTEGEFNKLIEICKEQKEIRVQQMCIVARELGLRIHEVARLDRSMIEHAIKNNYLTIKGKGGKVREIEVTLVANELFKSKLIETKRGGKLFISQEEKTDEVIELVQRFIRETRVKWQNEETEINRTFHGIRHAYARNQYENLRESGLDEVPARKQVSKNLGHNRLEVTKIYTEGKREE